MCAMCANARFALSIEPYLWNRNMFVEFQQAQEQLRKYDDEFGLTDCIDSEKMIELEARLIMVENMLYDKENSALGIP